MEELDYNIKLLYPEVHGCFSNWIPYRLLLVCYSFPRNSVISGCLKLPQKWRMLVNDSYLNCIPPNRIHPSMAAKWIWECFPQLLPESYGIEDINWLAIIYITAYTNGHKKKSKNTLHFGLDCWTVIWKVKTIEEKQLEEMKNYLR